MELLTSISILISRLKNKFDEPKLIIISQFSDVGSVQLSLTCKLRNNTPQCVPIKIKLQNDSITMRTVGILREISNLS